MRSRAGNTVLYRGFFCGEASQRNCVSEFEMVYGNTVRPDGEDQYLVWIVGASADRRLPHHRVCMECAWSVKCEDGIPKALLRRAGKGKVPDEVLWRKKSPYPKTYNPQYEALLADRLREEVLQDTSAPFGHFWIERRQSGF